MGQVIENREFLKPRSTASFCVGAFDVEPMHNELRQGEASFPVEPLIMDVLCYLARHAGRVVARQELINHVWFSNPDADESLTRAVSKLRGIFRHDSSDQTYIKTIWKRGYTLLAEPVHPTVAPAAGDAARPLPALSDTNSEYSIAVLPFRNNSAQADDAFLAEGITRDLTMLLSRVPRLRVTAYSSAAMVDERTTPLSEISQGLGVRYVVSGSLTRLGSNFQVRAELMDTFDLVQVWAQRIDERLELFFEIQNKLALDISTSIASALQISFIEATKSRRPFQLSAYELVQRAESLRLNYRRETALEIIELLDRALTLDPKDAAVHAALAIQHTQNIVSRFGGSPQETFALARRHVDTALELAPHDPDVLAAAGITATMMGNARLAVRHLRQSVELDPNNAHSLAVLGWQHCWLHGDPAGVKMIETAERRAPQHPRFSVWAHYRGHCAIRLGQVDTAITAYRDCVDRNPQYSLNLVTLAAALAFSSKLDEAREVIERVHEIAPDYRFEDYEWLTERMIYWFGDNPGREQMLDAMRRAWAPCQPGGRQTA